VAVDASGNLLIADTRNHAVRKVAGPGVVSLSTTALAFGGQSMGTTSAARTVTVTNSGGSALSISAVESSQAQFQHTHDCSTLAPRAQCTIRVVFSPAAAAGGLNASVAVGGTLSIVSNVAGSPHQVALSGSAEKSLIRHYYAAILGRDADAGGHDYWSQEAARLQSLGANINEAWFAMSLQFYNSPEYKTSAPSDADYLNDLYLTFFNRAPDSGGFGYWSSQLAQGLTRENVLQAFLFSAEFTAFTRAIFGEQTARAESEMVMDFYRGVLARLPDSDGYNYWRGRLRAAQCAGAAAVSSEADTLTSLFLNSPEYNARARDNGQYVSDLYNTFMRRGGDLPGQQYWISQLAGGATREQVRLAFLGSPEFQARVQAVIAAGCSN
jgi:hypothetical protein